MFPRSFPEQGEPRRWAEQQVFGAFSELDPEWRVFYSVAWQSRVRGRQGDGEADFVLVHPSLGILFAEVKGGSTIEIVDGGWYSWSRGQRRAIRSPVQQAVDSKYALRAWLAERVHGFDQKARLGHFVVFPAHSQQGDLGPDAPREIIVDRDDLHQIRRRVAQICAHWEPLVRLDKEQLDQVKRALSPDVVIRRFLKDRVQEIGSELDELTDRQFESLQLLRRQRKAMIVGGAGTGKTVIAVARARQLAADGFRTLMLCFNRPLGERLEVDNGGIPNLTVGSFHGLCMRLADQAGMVPDGPVDDEWWDDALPSALPDAAWKLNLAWDAIVVDEAQDFHPDWWTYLQMLMADPDGGILCVFADSNQDIYRKG